MRPFRSLYAVLLVPFLLVSHEQRCASKPGNEPVHKHEYSVSGTITQTHSYCGGARPPDELLAKLQAPHPFPGKKIYFRKGDVNTVDIKTLKEAVSDSSSHFHVMLSPGTYCVIEEDQVKALDTVAYRKKYATKYLVVDDACLKEWWGKCLTTLVVEKADKKDLTLNFHIPCFTQGIPCMKYTGPKPQ
jgi:hypothetical protein